MFCKWHNSWSHSTKNCIVFRDRIQEQIRKGSLKFLARAEKAMGIDTNPFPEIREVTANVIVPNFQKLPKKVKIPSPQELKGRVHYKWHNSWSHSTKNCIVFRDKI